MWSTFAEGVRAVPDPCSQVLVALSVIAVAVARYRFAALGGVIVASFLGVWNLAGGWLMIGPSKNWIAYLVAGASLVAIVVWRRIPWVAAAGGAGAVFAASLWWIPCVGPEFGSLLNDAIRDGVGPVAAPFAVYMVGLMSPAIAVAVAGELIARLWARRSAGTDGAESEPPAPAAEPTAAEPTPSPT